MPSATLVSRQTKAAHSINADFANHPLSDEHCVLSFLASFDLDLEVDASVVAGFLELGFKDAESFGRYLMRGGRAKLIKKKLQSVLGKYHAKIVLTRLDMPETQSVGINELRVKAEEEDMY